MCRPQKDPLRLLSAEERKALEQFSRSLTIPADQVIHAKEVLAVAGGHTFTDAAKLAGRKSGDAVAHLIARFNAEGLPDKPPRSSINDKASTWTHAITSRSISRVDLLQRP
jgi:hypothetical protein